MLTTSAIKKIKKVTNVTPKQDGNTFIFESNGVVLEVHNQEGDCLFIVVRRSTDHNDSMTDYVAGGMYYTIKGAIARYEYLAA